MPIIPTHQIIGNGTAKNANNSTDIKTQNNPIIAMAIVK